VTAEEYQSELVLARLQGLKLCPVCQTARPFKADSWSITCWQCWWTLPPRVKNAMCDRFSELWPERGEEDVDAPAQPEHVFFGLVDTLAACNTQKTNV
jgi:hypothetical protein